MSGTVRKISLTSEPQATFFLRVDWTLDLTSGFTLALTDGRSAWIGEVSEDEVTTEAENLGVTEEVYLKDLKRALTGDGPGDDKETYSFQLSADHSRLSYHKLCDGVEVRVGSADLHPAPDPVLMTREMIGQSMKQTALLATENASLLEENRELKRTHKRIRSDFDQLVQAKEQKERKLYSCFVMVMKEKKAKLRSLRDELDQLESEKKRRPSQELNKGSDQSVHPSQEPTVITAGRDMTCYGITMEPSDDGQESQQCDTQDTDPSFDD